MKVVSKLNSRAFLVEFKLLRFTVGAGGFDATQVGGSGVQSEQKAEVMTIIHVYWKDLDVESM